MLKSRLYWKVLANFGILIAIITGMTVLTGIVLRNIESNFQNVSDDTRYLVNIERLQNDLAELPVHADEYARTGDLTERLQYERFLREAQSRLTAMIEETKDSVSLSLLKDAEQYLSYWVTKSADQRIQTGDLITKSETGSPPGGMIAHIRYNDHHLDYSRNVLRELYRERIAAHQSNIENAAYISRNISTYIFIVNILIAIFAVVLGLVLSRSIVKPLSTLRESTERLTDGTYEPITLDRKDEIGDLARNFNQVSVLLYSQYKTLQVYSDLVTNLNASSSVRNVAARSLSHLCLHTVGYAGAIYLIDRRTKSLERVNSLGFETNGSIAHNVKQEEDIIGQCAASGRHIERTFESGNDLSIPGFPQNESGYLVALPMEFRERVIGVLLLASHEQFDNERMEIIQQSMPQIAVSITNARHYEETQNLSLEIAHKNKELHRKNAELEKAYRVKSDFLASISHELRTPLNSVIGYSSVLLNPDAEPLSADQQKALEKILNSGKHLLQLINDILDISKIEAGRMSLSVDNDSVKNVVAQAALTVEPLLIEKKLHLRKSMQSDLPRLKSDTLKIRQILINLLSNAVKFTEKGDIHMRVFQRDRLIHFEVRDPGIGIAEDNLETIFEEFRQIDVSSTRKNQGSGLGLPIARRLARLLGGDLTVKSRAGTGSIFTLSIPPALIPKHGSNGEQHKQNGSKHQSNASVTFGPYINKQRGLNILCIDDDPDAIDILKSYLVPEGYSVTSAFTGEEGIALARKVKPALITLDILLPGKDGWQVHRELKESRETRDIPVIIHSIIDNQPLALSLGAVDLMPKPVNVDKLMSLVQLSCVTKDHYVLLVDDNREFTMVMSELIEHDGFRVKTADSGARALEMIKESRPAIIFLDLVMPEMDGFTFIEKLKANESLRYIPVIILSCKVLSGKEKDYLESHIQYCMKKEEFSHGAFLNSIKQMLAPSQHPEDTNEKQSY